MAKVSLTGYGQNNSAVPSSLTPGEELAKNPYQSPLSEAHESVIANGVASNPQVRKIDDKAEVPPAFGHRDRNANVVKVPTKTTRR